MSVAATFVVTIGFIAAVAFAYGDAIAGAVDDRIPGTESEAVAGCQQLSRSKLANPASASYSDSSYKVSRDYRAGKWEVVGDAVAMDTSGVSRPFTYACVGAYPGTDGQWYADSMVNN